MGKILDITTEDEILKRADLYVYGLEEGLHGLAIDFGFHINNATENTKIFDISRSIIYRLNSSKFHFHLLCNQAIAFRKKHQSIIKSPVPPVLHLEIDKEEHSSLMDSIVFHLSSVLDYASILINYVLSKNPKNVKWGSIIRSAKDRTNIFSAEDASQIRDLIIEIDSNFADALYTYRSELIHNSDDVCSYDHSWNLTTNKVSLTFFCTQKVVKHFRRMGSKEDKYSITYFAQFVIFQTIESIKGVLIVLRKYLTDTLKEEDFVVSNKKPLILFDRDGNKLGAASILNWKQFDSIF